MALSHIYVGDNLDLNMIDKGCVGIKSGTTCVTFPVKESPLDYDSLATEDSGRDDTGQMHIQWILSRTRKINITLAPMSTDEVGTILNLVLGRIYEITFRDPLGTATSGHQKTTTMTCYTSNGSVKLYNGRIFNGIWQDAKFNAIEMKGES